jgi:general L-amino acid transport system substrate-binding protein
MKPTLESRRDGPVRRRRRVLGLAAALAAVTLASCGDDPEPAPTSTGPQAQGQPAPRAQTGQRESATVRAIRSRGRLNCGVNHSLPGFAYPDNRGQWRGFEVDYCRAVAVAVLGDREAVQFVPVSPTERFASLQAGEMDVLIRNTSHTFSRDTDLGLDFGPTYYFDGQGFLAARSLNLRSAAELAGARICIITGSTSESNTSDYFRSRGLAYEPVVVDRVEQARATYARQACDAVTDDISGLASTRSVLDNPQAHVILPDVVSKEPMGAVTRQGDDGWDDVVAWALYAMVLGEELGLTSQNVQQVRELATNEDARRTAPDTPVRRLAGSPEVRRLLGVEGGFGRMLGVSDDWAFQVIRQVGNYGEVFETNLGERSPLRLQRGLNALWTAEQPGLMYAPPVR